MKVSFVCSLCGSRVKEELDREQLKELQARMVESPDTVVCTSCKADLHGCDPEVKASLVAKAEGCDACHAKDKACDAVCWVHMDLIAIAGPLSEDEVVPVLDAPAHPKNLFGRAYICPADKTPCDMCQGTGIKIWGEILNGRPTRSGDCYRCRGKGYQVKEDQSRNWGYDNYHVKVRM